MLKHAIFEGVKNILRSVWLSLTAISVLSVSLISVVIIATLSTMINFTIVNFDRLLTIPAFFQEQVSEEDANKTLQELKDSEVGGLIENIRYCDKACSESELAEGGPAIDNLSLGNDNLTPRYIEIQPIDADSHSTIIKYLESEKFASIWADILADADFTNNFIFVRDWIRIGGIIFVTILAVISILVMSNLLRITIFTSREEIEVMRLVGATNNYIRWPFIMQGILYNLISSLIVLSLYIPLINSTLEPISSFLGISSEEYSQQFIFDVYLSLAATISAGVLFGGITAAIATQRYLKL